MASESKKIPVEIERKFLIKMPDERQYAGLGKLARSKIVQTYLIPNKISDERRIRREEIDGSGTSYFYTEKTEIAPGARLEKERKISVEEYERYLTEADLSLNTVFKTRLRFVYKGKTFELDIYPFNVNYAILEIELNDISETLELPPLTILKEVTDNKRFRNRAFALYPAFDVEELLIGSDI